MASLGTSERLLLEQPWVPVCLGGVQLLAKSFFADKAYQLLLTDLQSVWEEVMDTAAIQGRAQALNRRLIAPVSAFFSHLRSVACPHLAGGGEGEFEESVSAAVFSLHRSLDRLDIRIKSELAGIPFYWEFRCTPAPVKVVCSHLVQPLMTVSRVLQRQVGELGALLTRKDAELQDYKENGAVLNRARLKTEVFEEQSYRESFITQVLPEMCIAQDQLGFNVDLQELCAIVTAQGNGGKRKSPDSQTTGNHSPPKKSTSDGPALNNSTVPAVDLGATLGQAEPEPGPGPAEPGAGSAETGPCSAEPEGPQSEQTAYLNSVEGQSDRPSSRTRKKKAVGLFR